MTIGVIIFWLSYIIAAILLYHILRCSYKLIKVGDRFDYTWEKTDKKDKLPLWQISLFILALFIPVLNLILYFLYIGYKCNADVDRIYINSFLTKKY